jgi:hypothetical protein
MDILDSLSQLQKTSLFMRNYNDAKVVSDMMDSGFYIDDAYMLEPFISRRYKIENDILSELVARYFNEMEKLVATCPEYVVDNVYTLVDVCMKYENDDVINVIKSVNLSHFLDFDSRLNTLSQLGYKLTRD